MFVSVVLDAGSVESSSALSGLLVQYGFAKVQRACWESSTINERLLASLKKDVDKVTDYYDSVRMYQFPVEGVLAVTELNRKKWRKIVLRPAAEKK